MEIKGITKIIEKERNLHASGYVRECMEQIIAADQIIDRNEKVVEDARTR